MRSSKSHFPGSSETNFVHVTYRDSRRAVNFPTFDFFPFSAFSITQAISSADETVAYFYIIKFMERILLPEFLDHATRSYFQCTFDANETTQRAEHRLKLNSLGRRFSFIISQCEGSEVYIIHAFLSKSAVCF